MKEGSPGVTYGPNEDDRGIEPDHSLESSIIAGILSQIADHFTRIEDSRSIAHFTEGFDFDLLAILCGNPDVHARAAVLKVGHRSQFSTKIILNDHGNQGSHK